jgi:hypothetical protein
MNIIVSWGKDIGDEIKKSLPDGTKILRQQDNFERATLDVLLYNEDFAVVGDGCEVPRINLDIKLNDGKAPLQIIIPNKIILPC